MYCQWLWGEKRAKTSLNWVKKTSMTVYEVETDGMITLSTPSLFWLDHTYMSSVGTPTKPLNKHKRNRRNHDLQLRMKEEKGKLGWQSQQSMAPTFASLESHTISQYLAWKGLVHKIHTYNSNILTKIFCSWSKQGRLRFLNYYDGPLMSQCICHFPHG